MENTTYNSHDLVRGFLHKLIRAHYKVRVGQWRVDEELSLKSGDCLVFKFIWQSEPVVSFWVNFSEFLVEEGANYNYYMQGIHVSITKNIALLRIDLNEDFLDRTPYKDLFEAVYNDDWENALWIAEKLKRFAREMPRADILYLPHPDFLYEDVKLMKNNLSTFQK